MEPKLILEKDGTSREITEEFLLLSVTPEKELNILADMTPEHQVKVFKWWARMLADSAMESEEIPQDSKGGALLEIIAALKFASNYVINNHREVIESFVERRYAESVGDSCSEGQPRIVTKESGGKGTGRIITK